MIGTSFCVLAYIIIGNYGYVKLRINFNTASERKKKKGKKEIHRSTLINKFIYV